jgi:rRNA-processing protein FCF1
MKVHAPMADRKHKAGESKPKIRVILDTNFLIDLFRFKLRFEDVEDALGAQCDFFVMRRTVGELTGLPNKEAKVALAFIGSGRVGIIEPERRTPRPSTGRRPKVSADDSIIEFICKAYPLDANRPARMKNDGEYLVATNDQKLRIRLKPFLVRTVLLRAMKHIMVH